MSDADSKRSRNISVVPMTQWPNVQNLPQKIQRLEQRHKPGPILSGGVLGEGQGQQEREEGQGEEGQGEEGQGEEEQGENVPVNECRPMVEGRSHWCSCTRNGTIPILSHLQISVRLTITSTKYMSPRNVSNWGKPIPVGLITDRNVLKCRRFNNTWPVDGPGKPLG